MGSIVQKAWWALLFVLFVALGYGAAGWYNHRRAVVVPVAAAQPFAAPQVNEQAAGYERPTPREPIVIEGLVDVKQLDPTIKVELRYAGADNFTGKVLYSSDARCVLHQSTAKKLLAAQTEFSALGYQLKIWDAYRPLQVQRELWRAFPRSGFVANPRTGSMHNRGAAVDVTLLDADGVELPMPTGFDDFSPRAAIAYQGGTRETRENRELLARVMRKHGFTRIRKEWWHFEDRAGKRYPVQDIPFHRFHTDE